MATVTIKGELEIDQERGVIYFHAYEGNLKGLSQLRISQLPTPVPTRRFLDISSPQVDWSSAVVLRNAVDGTLD